jgi:thiamine-phosphate pyrophosphorylase
MHNKIPKYFTFISSFEKEKIYNLSSKVGIIYRNYKYKINSKQIIEIKNLCKKLGKKIYLANNVKLAIKNNLDGVYIPSFNKNLNYKVLQKKKNFLVMGSAHKIDEIKIKEKQGVELLFISPIFKNNKYKKSLGIIKFNLLSKITKIKIVALGGVNKRNLSLLKMANIKAISGIRFIEEFSNEK